MSESLKSFFILLGGLLVVLALWYLSVLVVRSDTRRRVARGDLRPSRRRLWIAATAGLPLIGFALYLFQRILSRYLTPPEPEDGVGQGAAGARGDHTEVRASAVRSRVGDGDTYPARPAPVDLPPGLIIHTGGNGAAGAPNGTATNGARRYQTLDTLPGTSYQPPWPRFDLVALEGPYAGEVFPLERLPLRIGRGPGAALALDNDLNVSRTHAEIYEWNGKLRVHDLGSTYGTLINGIPVTDQAFAPGDHLALGGTVLMLRELA